MWHAIQAALKQIDRCSQSGSFKVPYSRRTDCGVGVAELMRSYGEQKPLPFLELEAPKGTQGMGDYWYLALLCSELKALRHELSELRKSIDSKRI